MATRSPKNQREDAVALARVLAAERVAAVRLNDSGEIIEMHLHPSAYLLQQERESAAAAAKKKVAVGKDGLPVEPGNPLRDAIEKGRTREMLDGEEIDEDDPDMFSHTGDAEDAFSSR